MKYTTLLLFLFACNHLFGQEFLLQSPDLKIKVEVVVSANTIYRVYYRNRLIMHGKPIGLTVGKKNQLGYKEYSPQTATSSVDRSAQPTVAYRSSEIAEKYNELTLDFESGLGIDFRCFDEG
ncbi:MAG: hypothetical protein RL266_1358, partial [Bacteroidota bacterium]